jgi:hypothetical protein
MNINMEIEQLQIIIHLKSLLVLSKLAIMENDIQPTPSIIRPITIDNVEVQLPPAQANRIVINIKLREFMGCVSDKDRKNYMVMEGD